MGVNPRALYLAGIVLPLLFSCAKEVAREDVQPRRITLRAATEVPAGKVFVSDGLLTPFWSGEDKIAVFDPARHLFTISECSGSTALFEGEIGNAPADTLYAAYPFDAALSASGSTVSMVLPSEQRVPDGLAVDQAAMLSAAYTSGGSTLYFRNVGGLLRFEIKESDVTSVKIEGNGGEPLAGSLSVDCTTGVSSVTAASSSVTVVPQSGGAFAPGVFFAVAAPVALGGGITLTLTNSGGQVATKVSGNPAVIERSRCLNLGDVTTGLKWGQDSFSGGIIPSPDSDPGDDDIVSNTTFDSVVRVIFSNTGPAVVKNASALDVQIDGNFVTISNTTKSSIIYELSGSTSNGCFKLYSGKKQAIVLNDVSITNPHGAAINNQSGKRTFVEIRGTNTLKDGASYSGTPEGEDEKGAIFSEGQIIFSGSGSLDITASGKAGISSDDYVRFMSCPAVTVHSSTGNGIRGKDNVTVSNGILDISCAGNGSRGITSGGIVSVCGGTTSISMSGGVVYDSSDDDYKGTDAIKADNCFRMTGGTLNITNTGAGGKGIRAGDYDYDPVNHSVEDSYISGGTISISTLGTESHDVSGKAIKIGWITRTETAFGNPVTANAGNLIISGGNIHLESVSGECLEVKGALSIEGGELYASSKVEDAINAQGPVSISGGYIYTYTEENDSIDSNNNITVSGGYLVAITLEGIPENVLDAGQEFGYKVRIGSQANVMLFGKMQDNYTIEQTIYRFNSPHSGWNALYGEDGYLWAFNIPHSFQSVLVASPGVSAGYKDVTVEGASYCSGIIAASGISGGTETALQRTGNNGN